MLHGRRTPRPRAASPNLVSHTSLDSAQGEREKEREKGIPGERKPRPRSTVTPAVTVAPRAVVPCCRHCPSRRHGEPLPLILPRPTFAPAVIAPIADLRSASAPHPTVAPHYPCERRGERRGEERGSRGSSGAWEGWI
uniref:Uncharacterized protein n=1 Tax=Setaria viridis TaxID=4556 RepID=A0A4U6TAJ0_SETVI|nr:hypothetical protein SEVIR_9G270950v2 [Setaria viridis]